PVLMHRSSARCIPRPTTGASTHSFFSFLMPPRPPRSTLFPYTTLFRSLQQLRFRREELDFAQQLIGVVLKHFADEGAGGFYFTSDDHETLIHRMKSFSDDATPSGNGVAASVLLRLGNLLGEPRYLAAAERTLRAARAALAR